MPAPNMREYLVSLKGRTVLTVADRRPNTIVDVSGKRVLVTTRTGENWVSLGPLQELAERVYAGEEVTVPVRGRSAFYVAVLVTLAGVEYALRPRRVWLADSVSTFDAEYTDLFPDDDQASPEGRVTYRQHRIRERSPTLRRLKIRSALAHQGVLECEACHFDFARRYGALGVGFIECHHRVALSAGEERETKPDDLALLCANCHRMIHRTRPMVSVAEFRASITPGGGVTQP